MRRPKLGPNPIERALARASRPRGPRRGDPEGDLQRELVADLRLAGVDFCHVPNSTGQRGARRQAQIVALGVEVGVSDLLIFDQPPRLCSAYHGAALELKAKDRLVPVHPWDDKRATPEQRAFLRRRFLGGWAVAVCGPAEARAQLVAWGYL